MGDSNEQAGNVIAWQGDETQKEQIGKFMTAGKIGSLDQWAIDGRNCHLGFVDWYARWRKFVFHPAENTVFSDDCLTAMAAFLAGKTKERN